MAEIPPGRTPEPYYGVWYIDQGPNSQGESEYVQNLSMTQNDPTLVDSLVHTELPAFHPASPFYPHVQNVGEPWNDGTFAQPSQVLPDARNAADSARFVPQATQFIGAEIPQPARLPRLPAINTETSSIQDNYQDIRTVPSEYFAPNYYFYQPRFHTQDFAYQPQPSSTFRPSLGNPVQMSRRSVGRVLQSQATDEGHTGLVYVHEGEAGNPEERMCTYWLPEDYPIRVPESIRPKDPKMTQNIIKRLRPTIVYGDYQDRLCHGCRSRGICVHFTFLLGAKSIPDGLICDRCMTIGNEDSVKANRVCPIHNRRTLSKFLSSLPEDILATDDQRERAMDFMRRALTCDWDEVLLHEDSESVADAESMLNPEKGESDSVDDGDVDFSDSDEDTDDDSSSEDEHAATRPAKKLKTSHESLDIDESKNSKSATFAYTHS